MSGGTGRHLFDDPRNVRRVVRGLVAVCILLVGLDPLLHRHAEHPLEDLFGFYALYGFVACVLLVLLAKELRTLLLRDEHYYDRGRRRPAASADEQDAEDPHA